MNAEDLLWLASRSKPAPIVRLRAGRRISAKRRRFGFPKKARNA